MSGFSGLAPWLRPYASALMTYASAQVRVTSVRRSYSDQLALWLNRSRNPYPVAPPGKSFHQFGRAFDLAGPEAELRRLGAIWKSWGGTWSEKDVIHFQA